MFEYFMRKDFSISPLPARVEWPGNSLNPSRGQLNKHKQVHMGQFLQGGKNGRLMSFFFFKVEPPCDQT